VPITHSRAKEVIEEIINKGLAKEDRNEQEIDDGTVDDVNAIAKMINTRFEGKMKRRQSAKIFLEFLLEFLGNRSNK